MRTPACPRPALQLAARTPHVGAADDHRAGAAVVADRQPAPVRRQRLRIGTEEPAHVRRMLERRVEVDVVRDVEREVHRHRVERRARAVVRAGSGERFVPRGAAERHQRIERRLRVDVAEAGEVDDLVAVPPADSAAPPAGRRRRSRSRRATLHCRRVGLRAVGACEPRQIREEAALSIPSQVCGPPGPKVPRCRASTFSAPSRSERSRSRTRSRCNRSAARRARITR